MQFAVLALATVASATSFHHAERQIASIYPVAQVLPVPGYNATVDGFNSLGAVYSGGAGQLSQQAGTLYNTNLALNGSGDIQYNYDVKASLASSLNTINNILWQTAYSAEKQVCSIVTSINQQNVDTVKGNLRAGVYAEAQAIANVTSVLLATVAAIKAQAGAFVDTEKTVIAGLIQAIAAAVTASAEPAATLSAGLAATGVTSLAAVAQALQAAAAGAQAAAKIDWSTS